MKDASPSYLKHHLLIAMPHMADPHFAQTVTYLIEHNAEGAMGLRQAVAPDAAAAGVPVIPAAAPAATEPAANTQVVLPTVNLGTPAPAPIQDPANTAGVPRVVSGDLPEPPQNPVDAALEQRINNLLPSLWEASRAAVDVLIGDEARAAAARAADAAANALAPIADITVVAPGSDRATTRIRSTADGGVQLLCVATLTARKGHALLLQALAGLTHLDWTLHNVGSATRDPRGWCATHAYFALVAAPAGEG